MINIIAVLAFIFFVFYLPSIWLKSLIKKYSQESSSIKGSGREFAQHLLETLGYDDVKVESTRDGDCYDPEEKTVRLNEKLLGTKSPAAVAIAAHEVAHAIQHKREEKLFMLRIKLIPFANFVSRASIFLSMAFLLSATLLKVPLLALLFFLLTFIGVISHLLIHLVTLPMEFDASFNKAYPILAGGKYLDSKDLEKARKVLLAAALTYVANALFQFLSFRRFARMPR